MAPDFALAATRMMSKDVMIFFLLAVLSHTAGADRNRDCWKGKRVAEVVNKSYKEQLVLVTRGIPSDVVKFYFDEAFMEAEAASCVCSRRQDTRLLWSCLRTLFESENNFTIQALVSAIEADSGKEPKDQLFTRFHSNTGKLLSDLPLPVESEVTADMVWTLRKVTESLEGKTRPDSRFPVIESPVVASVAIRASKSEVAETKLPENTLEESPEMETPVVLTKNSPKEGAAEETLTAAESQDKDSGESTVPATAFIAYILGSATQILYAHPSRSAVEEYVKDAADLVFAQAQSQLASGNAIQLQLDAMVETVQLAQALMDAALRTARLTNMQRAMLDILPPLWNVSGVVRMPQLYYTLAVVELCALTRSDTDVYVTETGVRMSPLMALLDEMDLTTYAGLSMDPSTLAIPGRHPEMKCDEGYLKMNRLSLVWEFEENCCPKSCLEEDVAAFALAVFKQEDCCAACNQMFCKHAAAAPTAMEITP